MSASWRGRSSWRWSVCSSPSCSGCSTTSGPTANGATSRLATTSSTSRRTSRSQAAISVSASRCVTLWWRACRTPCASRSPGSCWPRCSESLIGIARLSENFDPPQRGQGVRRIRPQRAPVRDPRALLPGRRAERLPRSGRLVGARPARRDQRPRVECVLVRGQQLDLCGHGAGGARRRVGRRPLAPPRRRSHRTTRPNRALRADHRRGRAGGRLDGARSGRIRPGARRAAGRRGHHA